MVLDDSVGGEDREECLAMSAEGLDYSQIELTGASSSRLLTACGDVEAEELTSWRVVIKAGRWV